MCCLNNNIYVGPTVHHKKVLILICSEHDCTLTHCLLMPFETHRQITVEANVAEGYIDTGNINVSINLPWMLSDQLCKS